MDIRQLDDTTSVSPQITVEDIATLKELGFGAIICNRPDDEVPGQPSFAEIEQAAVRHGIQAVNLPFTGAGLTPSMVAEFSNLLGDLPGPVLAYCRSGTRSATIWSLAMAGVKPAADILAATSAAGYDMSGIAGHLQAR